MEKLEQLLQNFDSTILDYLNLEDAINRVKELTPENLENEIYEQLDCRGFFCENNLDAWQYLRYNDTNLKASLTLAGEQGYDVNDLDISILATLLKEHNNRKDFNRMKLLAICETFLKNN
jgi:hypothetical protein